MFLDYTPEQRALRDRLRAYFDEIFSDALRAELATTESGGPLYHEAMRRMGRDGWLGIGWPVEHGGQGRPAIEQFIFFDEVQRAGFPIPFLTLNTVGPTLVKFGSDAQRAAFLPRILRGELHFAIGYTEPDAGTDLASLKTRAVRDGDHYVINGQKIWTSLADDADYLWLACRTDPDAKKHKGISIIIVPMDSEGLQITPIRTLGDNKVFTTYLENVRVPVSNLVHAENEGWTLITSQLNHERVALFPTGPIEGFLEAILEWAGETHGAAGRPIDIPWVRDNLARVHAGLDVLRLMNWKQTANIDGGGLPPQEASGVKVFGSELYVEANRLLLEVLGAMGPLKQGSKGALLAGRLERYARGTLVLTFGGGTNEVQRDIIAMAGLRMPRSR